jgi:hypothetical protein
MCFQIRLSELLRRSAEQTVLQMIRLIFKMQVFSSLFLPQQMIALR